MSENNSGNKEHSIISPSASYSWLNCPMYISLNKSKNEAPAEEETTAKKKNAADRGTYRHSLGEAVINKYINSGFKNKKVTDEDCTSIENYNLYGDEKGGKEQVQKYVNYVASRYEEAKKIDPNAKIVAEQPLNLESYIPDGKGTSDLVLVYGDTVEIIDFKSGNNPVSAVGNTQERIYALGVLGTEMAKNAKNVKMSIVQPDSSNGNMLSTDEISASELTKWGDDVVKPAAELSNQITQNNGKNADGTDAIRKAGPWCKKNFCKEGPNGTGDSKGTCPAWLEWNKLQAQPNTQKRESLQNFHASSDASNYSGNKTLELDKTPVFTPYSSSYKKRKTENGIVEADSATLKRYYSSIDAEIYFGNEYVEEVCDIDYHVQQQMQPIYGFNSYTYDYVAVGTRIIQGTFAIRFISPNYLFDILKTAQEGSITNMKSFVVPVHERNTLLAEGTQNKTWNGQKSSDKFHCLWPETFDIDIIFGGKSNAGDAVHVVLEGVRILSCANGLSSSQPTPVTESYQFVANDIKTVV